MCLNTKYTLDRKSETRVQPRILLWPERNNRHFISTRLPRSVSHLHKYSSILTYPQVNWISSPNFPSQLLIMSSHPPKSSPFLTRSTMVTIFIILLVSVVQNSGAISSSTIRIQAKTEKGSEEKFVEYDPTKCNPSIPNAPDGRFRYIQTNGNCANVYEEKNCSGFFARLESAEVAFSVFSPDTSLWWGNNFVETTFKVKSVGPCWEKCDGRNWDNVDYANYNVTVGLGDKGMERFTCLVRRISFRVR